MGLVDRTAAVDAAGGGHIGFHKLELCGVINHLGLSEVHRLKSHRVSCFALLRLLVMLD